MSNQLTDEQKKFFCELAAQRKAKGIKLGRWCVMMNTANLEAVETWWDSWVRVFGKQEAADNLCEAMDNQHKLIYARLQAQLKARRKE